jgi:hypothetical protein
MPQHLAGNLEQSAAAAGPANDPEHADEDERKPKAKSNHDEDKAR